MGGLIGWSINMRSNMKLNNIFGKGLIAKFSLVLVFTALFSIFMFQGWYGPKKTQAAVANQTQWAILGSSTTNIAGLPAMSLAKGAGTSRLLVVSFLGDYSVATTTFQPTVTYGGQTLTRIVSTDTSSRQKLWIGYLNEAGIAAATGSPPAFAVSGVAPDTGCALAAAFYSNVDQGTPITGSRSVASDTAATTPPSSPITVTNGGWAIYALNTNSTTAGNVAVPLGYTEHFDTANGSLYTFTMGSKSITATGTEDPRPTWISVRYGFLTAALNPATTTVGDGTNPGNASLCPGGVVTMLDSFTLQTSTGTDTVADVTVTLAPIGAFNNIGLIEITNDLGGVVYGSVTNPAADAVTITTAGLSATTTLTQYKVRITTKIHPNMPVPPGASYAVTGTVTAINSPYAKTYSDTTSATVTIDNLSPNNPTAFSGTPGNTQVSLSWTNPGDADFSQVIVLRKAGSAVTESPSEGVSYSVGGTIGTSTVACVVITPGTTCTDTGLTNGTAYYYKIFAKDSCGNCSSGGTAAGPYTPNVTTVGNGTNPGDASLCPDGAATMLDAFTLQTSTGTDTVTAVQVFFAAGTSAGIGLVEITDDAGSTVYGSFTNPADTQNITLTSNITATTASTQYKVRITPRTHANMPVPPGASYAVTGRVTAITSPYAKTYSDATSATVTIDNLSPNNPTAFSGTPGNAQVSLSWTNPVVGDFSQVVVLRKASAAVTESPSEGVSYSVGGTIGTSTVACVVNTPGTTCTDTGLTNGTAYYYKILAKDSCGNYSSGGTTAGPYTPNVTTVGNGTNPGDASLCPGGAVTMLDSFTLQTSTGTDTVTNVTVTLMPTGAFNNIGLIEITNDLGGVIYGSVTNPAVDAVTITTAGLSATTTSTQYKVRVTPKTHANMPVPPGASYAVTGTVTAITSTYAKTYSDTTSATVTLDNGSPSNATWGTITAGDQQITLNWTNPVDGDFSKVLILRKTSSISDIPVEGTIYVASGTIGTSIVVYVGNGTTFTDTGLTNGTTYYYKIFAYDTCINYATGAQTGPHTPNAAGVPPTLTYPASPYNDGKNPDTGDTTTDFTFKVIYTDAENDPPAAGYPKIYIGDHDGFVSYIMTAEDPGDTNYTDGKIYYFTTKLGAAQDLRFYFEVQASTGDTSIVRLPSNAPTSFNTGPAVYLLYGNNMVGVPKDLGAGLSYSGVLGDDSGYLFCYTWDSAGLDVSFDVDFVGEWIDCASDNVQTGKGYYIWATASNYWRLDEPSGTGNVAAANFNVDLDPDGGWNMISNPYNGIVQLQNIKVVRSSTDYTFSQAVTNGWIGNSIYAYEGPTTGYTFSAYNDTPPAILKPWGGYFIYMKDTTPTTLRIYAP